MILYNMTFYKADVHCTTNVYLTNPVIQFQDHMVRCLARTKRQIHDTIYP